MKVFQPSAIPQTELTVGQVIDFYLDHISKRAQAGDYTPHALEDLARELRRFAAVHGAKLMSECRKYDLTSWLVANKQWRSNHTRKRVLGTIVRPFLWAEDQELIPRSPYRKPKDMRLPTRPRRPAEHAEYVILMRHASRALRRALFFLRRSGCRTCEMREVRWDEVDFERGVIVKEKHKTAGVTGRPRLIGLDRATVRFLRNLHRQRPENAKLVFLNCHGKQWNRHSFARQLRRLADKLGMASDLSAYCLRHTVASDAIEAGIGEKQVADQFGHSDTRMMGTYVHTRGRAAHLRSVAEEMNRRRKRID